MENKIAIGLVEDQYLFREGMKAILSHWPELEMVFETDTGLAIVDQLKSAPVLAQVMLVDLSLGNEAMGGRDVTLALGEKLPDIKVIILSAHQDENFIAELIESGAHGYLVKDCNPSEVREAILSVYHKGSYINERTLKALQRNSHRNTATAHATQGKSGSQKIDVAAFIEQLTKREQEILQLICQQLTSDEIAEKLFISPKTVNGHRSNMMDKTGSKNIAGLVVFAIKHKVVTL
jgi:two-component system, NarL family, response regulator NreC